MKQADAGRVAQRYLEAKRGPNPNPAERAALSAFQWGHITRAQLDEKLGAYRAKELLGE